MPSSLLIEDSTIMMVTASPEGRIEFLKNPEDKVIITRYGNLTNPTDQILVLRTVKSRTDKDFFDQNQN